MTYFDNGKQINGVKLVYVDNGLTGLRKILKENMETGVRSGFYSVQRLVFNEHIVTWSGPENETMF